MKRLADFRKHVIEGWTVQRIAAVLMVVGLVIFVAGVVNKHCACAGWPNLGETLNDVISDFYANVSIDCLSIAFAILVIDRLNERRAEKELKAQLIREMGSSDNGIAVRAVNELRARGWLQDGSLRNAYLFQANLQGAELRNADLAGANLHAANLREANLYKANLAGADLLDTKLSGAFLRHANLANVEYLLSEQLVIVECLCGATLPDGSKYDGPLNLNLDFAEAKYKDLIDIDDPEEMAKYYGVPLEDYLAGQEWAHEHLADLRRSAGLDLATGWPVEPTNGVEPQPTDAPAPPAPRRNGHKASMVSHRVRW